MKAKVRHITISITSLLLSACANMTAGNLFSHYSAQNQNFYQTVKQGQYAEATDQFEDYVAGDILDNLEKGRVYFLNEQYAESKATFELSDAAIKEQQSKALISISDTATSVGSLAVNDNLNDYQPADYELGFLHLYLGLNYVQANDLDGALVEMRRANQVQEQARANREAELESAQNQLRENGVSANLGSVLSKYPDAGKTLQAVQNGYLLYLSALLYEASNDLNSAYVDYRRALTVAPDNKAVIEGTLRVAERLAMKEDLSLLEKQYGLAKTLRQGEGRVIILDEQGIVKAMESWRLSLPLYDSRGRSALYSLALPYYNNMVQQKFYLQLNGQQINSSVLANVDLMAQRNLSEKMPAIAIRQALRVIAKDQLRKETTNGNDIGNLVLNVWNTLTEQPDTRSWITLPASVYGTTEIVPSGEQTLNAAGKTYHFNVPDQGTTLVWVSQQGSNATMWHKQLGKL
ncbi:COG3014 family protein [Vibrio ziniensis]|uniref:Uncharacterized protein n=1 Tax=Vibrio ziniensis TaxID=2711221 RepID=A0A6G7CH07_9VIBR|nr:hypothetical protein [Vibrio ziniensis]QIH41318.1 hypothetical protein G5S32_04635 [Vibrio ziniensis]